MLLLLLLLFLLLLALLFLLLLALFLFLLLALLFFLLLGLGVVHGGRGTDELPVGVGLIGGRDLGGELAPGDACQDRVHVVRPEDLDGVLRGALHAADIHHLARIGIARPANRGKLRRVSAEPQVLGLVGGAGLAGHGLVDGPAVADHVGGAAVDDALQNLGGRLSHAGLEHLLGVVLVLVDHVAVAVFDAGDGDRVAVHAAVCQRGVGLAHLDGRHAHRAQGDGEVVGQRLVDAHELTGLDDLLGTDGLCHLRIARVGRHCGCACERAGAVVVVGVVLHQPRGGDLHRGGAVEHDVGVHALANRGHQRVGLEARAALAPCLRGQVELALLVVAAAHHGHDVAGGVVDAHQRDVETVVLGVREVVGAGALGLGLVVRGDGGVDLEAALQDGVGAEVLEQQLAHVVGEVGVGAHGVDDLAEVEHELLGAGGVELLLGDVAGKQHAVEHLVATSHRGLGVLGGIEVRRGLRQAHEQRGLGERELGGALVEVGDARGLDAVGAMAVVDGVEVHHEDLVLGEHLLHLDRDVGLAHLAAEGVVKLLVGEDRVANELLRDGGGAFGAACQVGEHRADDALRVDAVVLVEADVLDVDGGVDDPLRDLVHRDGATVLQVVLGDLVAVGVIERRGLCDQIGVGRLVVGQVLEPRRDDGAQREHEGDDEQEDETEDAGGTKADGVGLRVVARSASTDTHGTSL